MARAFSAFIWHGFVRLVLFWSIVSAAGYGLERWWPWFDGPLIYGTLQAAVAGDLDGLSTQPFAFALASGLGAIALALAAAFFLLHVLMIRLSLGGPYRRVKAPRGAVAFSGSYPAILQRLERHRLIGHAWHEFNDTLVLPRDEDGVIRNTVRPQSFFNIDTARSKLFGLKMMGSIPGYFVGVGLLLTFIGLVLALHKASAAVSASDTEGMQAATRQLLQVATFKFATSIAGLGASIFLAFLFRAYSIWIEGAFSRFAEAVERQLLYAPPQALAAESNETLAEQLTELKAINGESFFSRMGEVVAPQIQSAFSTAMAPITTSIDQAVNRLSDNSQSGMTEMLSRFSETLQGSAGAEMREMAAAMQAMQASLQETQRGLHGTGEDFGRRMSEAAENLNRLIVDAGEKLGDGSEKSRAALLEVVASLRETFEQADRKVDEDLGRAAAGASARVEDAMGRVLGRLESQVGAFNAGVDNFQESTARGLEETREKVAAANAAAVETVGRISEEAAKAMQAGVRETLQQINQEFERFITALRSTEGSLLAQANSVREATIQSGAVADAFARTAQEVRAASGPLVQSGDRIAGATERMTETVARSVVALEAGQASSKQLSEALIEHIEQLSKLWNGYASRFDGVDEDLARAIEMLADATRTQGQTLADYAAKVDSGFATAIERLNPFLEGLRDNTEELGEEVLKLRRTLIQSAVE